MWIQVNREIGNDKYKYKVPRLLVAGVKITAGLATASCWCSAWERVFYVSRNSKQINKTNYWHKAPTTFYLTSCYKEYASLLIAIVRPIDRPMNDQEAFLRPVMWKNSALQSPVLANRGLVIRQQWNTIEQSIKWTSIKWTVNQPEYSTSCKMYNLGLWHHQY